MLSFQKILYVNDQWVVAKSCDLSDSLIIDHLGEGNIYVKMAPVWELSAVDLQNI